MSKEKTGYPSVDRTHERHESYFHRNPIIPSMSLYNVYKLLAMLYKNDIAIDCLDLNVTYKELNDRAVIVSAALKELGVKENDIITVSMPNFYQAVAVYLAANRIGAAVAFLNPLASIEEIERYLNEFESPILVNFDKTEEYNKNIKKSTKVKQIITLAKEDINNKDFNDVTSYMIGNSDFVTFQELELIANFYSGDIKTKFKGEQDSLILFTSGSTGNPKCVVLTNKNILASGIYMKNSTNIANTRGERSLVCVPFCYPYGFATSTLMSLLCGRTAVLGPNLSADTVTYYLKKNPNIVFGSPALLELVKRNTPKDLDLSSIQTFISGGDFLYPSQATAGIEFFKQHGANVVICNGAGNAETVGASTNAVGQENRPETVGKVLIGEKVIVVNQDDLKDGIVTELKYGEEGLLCIAGKNVFKEYFNEPKLTEETKFMYKGNEYIKSGMIGYLDEDGYFYLTGRESRYYILSTLNKVYCEHVQNIMSVIDVIDDCAVVEKPDDTMLYTGKAYVVLKPGVLPDEETKKYITDRCFTPLTIPETGEEVQLKPYEVPASIEFIPTLPRNQADKVDYILLKDMAREEYESEKKNSSIKKLKK